MSYTTEEVKYIFVYQLYFIYIGTFVSYHYHWVGTHLGGQLVPPRVPVHVFVTTTTGSVPILVDSWSLHEYQYIC